ncbi:uncharacterized protein LOC114281893 [Camellia sinensis]|uniref:uncharacterized protein LOC114281893 n=1 Tax=Camellia sinensis TaxID=4442 RepID=UPI001035D467|nr:uncharacterized protein LOC114281893 [Camellia sinensis]
MVHHPPNDVLVVTLKVRDCQARHILIDQGNSCDIMYVRCYKELGLHKDDLKQSDSPMVGFNGTLTWLLETTRLEVQAGTKKVTIEFTIINTPFLYNNILGRPWLHAMRDIPSTLHQLLRFPAEQGIKEVRGDQVHEKNCSMVVIRYTCNVREVKTSEIESEDWEVLDDVDKEPVDNSEEPLKKVLVQEGDEE